MSNGNDRERGPAVRLRAATLRYPLETGGTFRLGPVNLSIPRTGVTLLTGPSGGGKSTLLRIMGLLTTPDAGEVEVLGRTADDARGRDRLRARHIGLVFQDHNLLGHLTVRENLAVTRRVGGPWRRLSRRLGLEGVLGTRASLLSGGEAQRAGICRALVNDPDLLLLDEPTSALDDDAASRVLGILDELRHVGVTMVVASHDPRVRPLADRTVRVRRGEVTADA